MPLVINRTFGCTAFDPEPLFSCAMTLRIFLTGLTVSSFNHFILQKMKENWWFSVPCTRIFIKSFLRSDFLPPPVKTWGMKTKTLSFIHQKDPGGSDFNFVLPFWLVLSIIGWGWVKQSSYPQISISIPF